MKDKNGVDIRLHPLDVEFAVQYVLAARQGCPREHFTPPILWVTEAFAMAQAIGDFVDENGGVHK